MEVIAPAPLLGLLAVAIALVLRENRYALASLVLMALGVGIVAWQGKLRGWKLALCLVTAALSVVTNMAVGFLAGLALAYGVRALKRRSALPCLCAPKEATCYG